MGESKSLVLLKHHLKTLRLLTMERECDKVASRAANENLDHLAFLLQLLELELIEREQRASERRLKAAKFAYDKSLDEVDFRIATFTQQVGEKPSRNRRDSFHTVRRNL